ncbi:RNA-binding protein [Gemella cuniculi]|uniref:YlmH family RNA-binding protein n=1 Tax=Gemella cuniculi TaxID=150240 RepID=UPI000413E22B|nr:YlmH/Sll1252 family protein [Gemella cuniculi]
MKKLNFLAMSSKEELAVAEKLLQTINFSSNKNTVTNFLTNFEQIILEKLIFHNYKDFKVEFFGGIDTSERKKAKIISNDYYDIKYGICCLKATYNNKFNELKHKDVLGAVYNLGLNFNRFGDIVVQENEIYLFVDEEIVDFVTMNLSKIGRVNISLEKIEFSKIKIEKQFSDFEIVTSSLRVDAIAAKITNKSRSKIKEFLEQEFIKVNHVVIRNGEKTCSTGDIISIRRYGRFIFRGQIQNKKSLKYRVTMSKPI